MSGKLMAVMLLLPLSLSYQPAFAEGPNTQICFSRATSEDAAKCFQALSNHQLVPAAGVAQPPTIGYGSTAPALNATQPPAAAYAPR